MAGLTLGQIGGISIGVLFLLAAILIIVLCLLRGRKHVYVILSLSVDLTHS